MMNLRPKSALTLAPVLTLALIACGKDPPPEAPAALTSAPSSVSETSSTVTAFDERKLRDEANLAIQEGRMISPDGHNAFEYFLTLRESVADDADLRLALSDLMPYADQAAKFAIANDDGAEANRIVQMMERYDMSSATTRAARERVQEYQRQQALAVVPPKAAPVAAPGSAATQSTRAPAAAPTRPVAIEARSTDSDPRSDTTRVSPSGREVANPAGTDPQALAAQASAAPPSSRSQPAPPAVSRETFAPPSVVRQVAPQFPPQAKRQGQTGVVELDVLVDINGDPQDIRVARAVPEGIFDRAAVRAMMRWKFEPARRNGKAEPARTRVILNFRQ